MTARRPLRAPSFSTKGRVFPLNSQCVGLRAGLVGAAKSADIAIAGSSGGDTARPGQIRKFRTNGVSAMSDFDRNYAGTGYDGHDVTRTDNAVIDQCMRS